MGEVQAARALSADRRAKCRTSAWTRSPSASPTSTSMARATRAIAPLREAIAQRYGVDARAGRRRRRHVDGQLPRDGGADLARRRSADRASDLRAAARRGVASSAPTSSGSNASPRMHSGSIQRCVAAAMSDRTRLIVLTNLHNPSGALGRRGGLRAIGELARQHGARVLIDEVYLDAAVPPRRERRPPRPRVRLHQQPDQGVRPQRPALRLDPRRAGARRADVAAQRPVRSQPGASGRAARLHRVRAYRRGDRRQSRNARAQSRLVQRFRRFTG